jgi:hypothetical protein
MEDKQKKAPARSLLAPVPSSELFGISRWLPFSELLIKFDLLFPPVKRNTTWKQRSTVRNLSYFSNQPFAVNGRADSALIALGHQDEFIIDLDGTHLILRCFLLLLLLLLFKF